MSEQDVQRIDTPSLADVERGMHTLRLWRDKHPNPTGPVVLAGRDEDSLTPQQIVSILEGRIEDKTLWTHHDVPEEILKSAMMAKD